MKKPVAIVGLTIIILVLLGSSIGSFIIIWRMNDQVNEAVHIEDLYQQARYLARSEDGVSDEYYLNPGDYNKNNYNADADALNAIFYILAERGDASDHALTASLLQAHKFYILRTYQFFYMVDIHDTRARSFYNSQVNPLAIVLSTRLQTELNTDHQESIKRTAQLKMTEQIVATSLILVFLSSILLFITGYNMLSKYQREMVRARQAEWEQMEQLA
ncbi:MAG: hypothetical protein H0V70_00100, partial [Ktedonobacteraceae bacterium]|nr:hypothetical protein [Ktedonobacteraceae bacterium]